MQKTGLAVHYIGLAVHWTGLALRCCCIAEDWRCIRRDWCCTRRDICDWDAFALDEKVCFAALRSLKNMILVLSAELSIT